MNKILSFLKKKTHPRQRYIYAVTAGAYLGELLVYIDTETSTHNFLSLPEMHIRKIPTEKFYLGIEQGIVDVVEKLPRKIYNTCKLQYKKNNVQSNI
jgi:hypothetical protein